MEPRVNWLTLSFGDLSSENFVALAMLIPFRLLLYRIQEISTIKKKLVYSFFVFSEKSFVS